MIMMINNYKYLYVHMCIVLCLSLSLSIYICIYIYIHGFCQHGFRCSENLCPLHPVGENSCTPSPPIKSCLYCLYIVYIVYIRRKSVLDKYAQSAY